MDQRARLRGRQNGGLGRRGRRIEPHSFQLPDDFGCDELEDLRTELRFQLRFGRQRGEFGAGAVVAVVDVVEHGVVLEAGHRAHDDADAERVVVQIVEIAAGRQILGVAFAAGYVAGHADCKRIAGDRYVYGALQFSHRIVAARRVEITAEFAGRLFRLEEDGAAGRVTPEQRTLRPAQDLNILHVVIIGGAAGTERHFVEIGLHAGIGATEGLALATDGEHVIVARAEIGGHRERGRKSLQVCRAPDVVLANGLRGERRDRDGNAFEIFRPPPGGDDDGLDRHALAGLVLGRGWRVRVRRGLRAGRRSQHRRAQEPKGDGQFPVTHDYSPSVRPSTRTGTLKPPLRLWGPERSVTV